jgi:hypothetical protein
MNMVQRRALAALAAGIAMLGVGIPAASASTNAAVTQVIKVETVTTATTYPTPLSFMSTENLVQGKRIVGHDAITCSFASQTATTGQCTGVLWFNRAGAMFISATAGGNGVARGRILDGTGAYQYAHGTVVHISKTSSIGWATLTFSLAH